MSNNYEQNNQNKYNNSYDESENSKNSQNKQNRRYIAPKRVFAEEKASFPYATPPLPQGRKGAPARR